MLKLTESQARLRDGIIFGKDIILKDRLTPFANLELAQLGKLVENNLIDLSNCQNDSPNTSEFLAFMRKWPCATAHGYVIKNSERDSRVIIEGLDVRGKENITDALRLEFFEKFDHANEFENTPEHLYCWWD
jgi:hypothetical protein